MVNGLSNNELKEFLDSKYEQYNQKKFIESDFNVSWLDNEKVI